MKLAELVAGMPATMRQQICRYNGWDDGREADLSERLSSERTIGALCDSLYDLERRTLALVLRHFGYEPFDWTKLEKAGRKQISGAAVRVGLIRLCQRGILFALRRNWGEFEYVLPEDAFPVWRGLLMPVEEGAVIYAENDAAADTPYSPGIAAYLLFVLSYIAKEEVTVTQKGGMHKRHAGRLGAAVPIRDDELTGTLQRPKGGRSEYGSWAVGYLCEIALLLGLIEKHNDRLTVRPERLSRWFALPEREMNDWLYALWKEEERMTDPWLQHVFGCLEQIPEERWVSLASVTEQMERIGIGCADLRLGHSDKAKERATLLSAYVSALAAWGWAEAGSAASGEKLFRWIRKPSEANLSAAPSRNGPSVADETESKHATAEPRLFVQPDFELIVPPDCPYAVRWELEMIAERMKCEQVAVYRLTRDTIIRALDYGRTAEEMIGFLERWAKYGVPDHVRTAIADWGDRQSQLRLAPAIVLKCRDEAAADMVRKDERVAPLLEEALGATAWIVRADKVEELRLLLAKSGFSPGGKKRGADEDGTLYPKLDIISESFDRPGGLSPAAEGRAAPAKGLIYSKAAVKYYDNERQFPLIEDVYPGLQEVPPMWLKDCRAYHVSTRKQMIQKALEWKACLRLRKAGDDKLFIPIRLDGIRDDWAVTGFEDTIEVRLSPDEWEEMQLILPGVND